MAPTLGADAFAQTVLHAALPKEREQAGASKLPTGGDRFALAGLLGQGGMGRVVVATDRQFGRSVAVKELLPGIGSQALLERFAIESVVTGNLEHPGVPAVYERGVREDGTPFYSMRLVSGETLARRMAAARTMRERLALLPAIVRLAHTLAFAHEHGVVHRDVKPDNVILGKHGETVLLDWGIAKVRGEVGERVDAVEAALGETGTTNATVAGTLLGTPAYMAPEQASARVADVDERTDVFAVGAVLYHLLTGRPPYDGPTTHAIVLQASRATPEPMGDDVPEALAAIVRRAMARDRDARFQTATELAEALDAFLTEAVATKEARAVGVFADVASWLGFLLVALLSVLVLRMALPALRTSPLIIMVSLLIAGLGILLSIFESTTRGRLSLSRLSLAFAATTMLLGVLGSCVGYGHVLQAAAAAGAVGDILKRDRVLLGGSEEALVAVTLASALTALQLVIWAIARRRVDLTDKR